MVELSEKMQGLMQKCVTSCLNFIMPPLCNVCYQPVAESAQICATCWQQMTFIIPPYCDVTGMPFVYDLGEQMISPKAIASPPEYDKARAVVKYDDIARQLVHGLKYYDRHELAILMGRLMTRTGRAILSDADLILPIPLFGSRLWKRRFNQSGLLAQQIGKQTNLPVDMFVLQRTRATRQQVGLTAKQRHLNVAGAFAIDPKMRHKLTDKNVVLVDDVLTSGATVNAAAKVLKRNGASSVRVLVFAQVAEPIETFAA